MPTPPYRLTSNGRWVRSASKVPVSTLAELSSTKERECYWELGQWSRTGCSASSPPAKLAGITFSGRLFGSALLSPNGLLLLCWLQRRQLTAPNLNLQCTPPGEARIRLRQRPRSMALESGPLSPYGEPDRDNQVGNY